MDASLSRLPYVVASFDILVKPLSLLRHVSAGQITSGASHVTHGFRLAHHRGHRRIRLLTHKRQQTNLSVVPMMSCRLSDDLSHADL